MLGTPFFNLLSPSYLRQNVSYPNFHLRTDKKRLLFSRQELDGGTLKPEVIIYMGTISKINYFYT